MTPKSIKLALALCAITSAIGVVFGGLAHGYDLHTILVYGLMGAFLGAVGAPEVEPKYFKSPITWQIMFATSGCLLFAYAVASPFEGYVLAVIAGIILGYTAHFWIKHVVFP